MNLEELKAEAKRQGYKLIKAKTPRFERCLCGHNVHQWVSGPKGWAVYCKHCGLEGPWVKGGNAAVFWRKGRSKPMDEIKRALLGDHEAAKRLTEAGVLLPCPGCKGDNIVDWYRHNEVWYQCDDCGWEGPSVYSKGFADTEQARLAWNTRAPILSAEEMEMLEGMK